MTRAAGAIQEESDEMNDDARRRPAGPQPEHEPGIPVRVAVAALVMLCVAVAAVYVVLFAH